MWCPTCRAEYVEDVRRCPVCDVDLVSELPDEIPEYIPDTWKLAAEYTDEIAASLAEGLLEDNDIPCKLENLTFHAEPIAVSQSFSRVRVWVEEDNLAAAQTLLAEADNFALCSECGAAVKKEDTACPQCGVTLEDEPAGD